MRTRRRKRSQRCLSSILGGSKRQLLNALYDERTYVATGGPTADAEHHYTERRLFQSFMLLPGFLLCGVLFEFDRRDQLFLLMPLEDAWMEKVI